MTEAPIPQNNESQEQYTVRAHQLLRGSVQDPDARNTMIWSAWSRHQGPTKAELVAEKELGNERFVKVPNYCYFKEHETLDNDGNPVRFSVTDLAEITATMNRRAGSKAFAAISDNHTSPTDQSHTGDPPVLGATGAYRLGMIDDEGQQKYSIFADEYHYAEAAGELAKKPRRSVELITFKNTGERFFDPIAALGGRAPRLAMPTRFNASSTNAFSVCRYSTNSGVHDAMRYQFENEGVNRVQLDQFGMEGPALLPSGGNTHIKSTDYYGDESPDNQEMTDMQSISDEDIRSIINAIGNMPESVWVRGKMEEENGGAVDEDAPGQMDDVGSDPDDVMDQDFGEDEMMDDDELMGDDELDQDPDMDVSQNGAMRGPSSGQMVSTPPSEDADFDDQQQFMADGPLSETKYEDDPTAMYSATQRFSALQAEHNALRTSHINLMKQFGTVAKAQKSAEQASVDADRRADINDVCSRYSIFDSGVECDRLLYSAGNQVSDEQFHNEMRRLIELGNRSHQTQVMKNTIPPGITGQQRNVVGNGQVSRNAAWFEKSMQIQTNAANNGEFHEYDALCELTDKAIRDAV